MFGLIHVKNISLTTFFLQNISLTTFFLQNISLVSAFLACTNKLMGTLMYLSVGMGVMHLKIRVPISSNGSTNKIR